MAAASTGTAEAAKGLIEAEAMVERVRLGEANFSTRNGRFQRVRARRERVSEMQDPAGGGASAGEGPHRRRKEGKAKTNCGERSKVFFFFFSLSPLPLSRFFLASAGPLETVPPLGLFFSCLLSIKCVINYIGDCSLTKIKAVE